MSNENERYPNPTLTAFTRRGFLKAIGLAGVGLATGQRILGQELKTALSAPAATRGGTLRYGMVAGVPSLDPHRFGGAPSDVLYGMVYNRLVQLRSDLNGVDPELAERWEASVNGKVFTFTLRRGVKFQDGSTLTAEDVTYSFQRILDPKTGAYVRSLLADDLAEVTAVDQNRVRFVLRRPYAAFLAAVALPTAAIMSKRWVESGANPNVTMMGTGPMKFVSLEPNVRINLARHTGYFERGLPYLDGVTLLFLPDETARTTALRSGSVDFIDYVPWKDLATIKADPSLRVYSDLVSTGAWAFINTKRSPLNNKLVRQAVNWAANRQAMLGATYFGHGEAMDGIFMPKTSWAFVADVPKYGHSPDRARELLRSSGVPAPLRIELLGVSNVRHNRIPMEVLQANLRDVGIEARLELVEFGELVRRLFASDFDIAIWGGGPTFGDPDYLYTYFHSRGQYGAVSGFSNPQIDLLLEEARRASSRLRRKNLYAQAYKLVIEEAPWVPMVYREQGEASSSKVQGYERVYGTNWNGIRVARVSLSR